MTPQFISLLSTFSNLALAISKLIFGFFIGSSALIADGLHSGLDVFSSFITFLGIKIARKPIDEKHPYGYWKAENIAGLLVAFLLLLTSIWIFYEAITKMIEGKPLKLSSYALIVVVVSIVVSEILARLKFYVGEKFKNLALVADAEHSRADALSSIGVLIGLFLSKYFPLADGLIALGIGGYLFVESFKIGKEISEALLDVRNFEVEEKIKKICKENQIEISFLRTRKIGPYTLAEIKINLPPRLKIEKVQEIVKSLEEKLLKNIAELKEVIISITPYDAEKTILLPNFGGRIERCRGFEKIGPEKLGERIIIPLEKENRAPCFGASKYLIIDLKDGKILKKEVLKNPYFESGTPHGFRFARAIRADKIIVSHIGPSAKRRVENVGIEVEIVPKDKTLEEIISELTFSKPK
ncbi:cation diffusion facilitator family transporter [bacterium]|nr:cation diffusion facilitator family transporter [bacterium]